MRVSDADREQAGALLREHWLAGRLDADEFDERSAAVWGARTERDLVGALRQLPATHRVAARPAKADSSGAIASLVLGIAGLVLFFASASILSALVLPLSATAWALGRRARRQPGARRQGAATAGLVLGILGTALSLVFLAGFAAILVLFL